MDTELTASNTTETIKPHAIIPSEEAGLPAGSDYVDLSDVIKERSEPDVTVATIIFDIPQPVKSPTELHLGVGRGYNIKWKNPA